MTDVGLDEMGPMAFSNMEKENSINTIADETSTDDTFTFGMLAPVRCPRETQNTVTQVTQQTTESQNLSADPEIQTELQSGEIVSGSDPEQVLNNSVPKPFQGEATGTAAKQMSNFSVIFVLFGTFVHLLGFEKL